ncbi:hypothetical protein [Streptomyces candidus]|uniref:CHAD domain-containing protein n=1 Tax=Streptomyces candidus TaxID=67283 RepID=A0A7X0HL92_9ACTN|nr:hypothetical protein [Streptomyces candidus]MBB6438439.1 hypothetical protein [Streptomyces candidus]
MPDAGGPPGGTGDLERGVGALKKFRSRVHAILATFEDGDAGTRKAATHTLSRAHFGAPGIPFPEADDLHAQYRRVHTGLVQLSRSLTEQIECLSIAVHGAEVGFDNLEEDLRRRFWAIRTRTEAARTRAEHERDTDESRRAPG